MRTLSKPMFNLADRLCDLMEQAEKCFKPGAMVTLVVRNPMVEDGDVVMGNDDPAKVIACIEKMSKRIPIVEAGERIESA